MANPAFVHFYVLGIDQSAEDAEDDDDQSHDHVDVEDLAAQFDAARASNPDVDVRTFVKPSVEAYLQWWDRNEMIDFFREVADDQLDEEEIVAETPAEVAAFAEWVRGYRWGLEQAFADAVMDAYVEAINEREDGDGEDVDLGPAHANPAKGEPLAIWSQQGTWDAEQAFSTSDLKHDLDLGPFAAELLAAQKAESGTRRQNAGLPVEVAGRAVDAWFALLESDPDYYEEWKSQNEDAITEYGHDPEKAFREWKAGFRGVAAKSVASALRRLVRESELEGDGASG